MDPFSLILGAAGPLMGGGGGSSDGGGGQTVSPTTSADADASVRGRSSSHTGRVNVKVNYGNNKSSPGAASADGNVSTPLLLIGMLGLIALFVLALIFGG